jgi:protein-tyrosine phosphatase
MKVFWVSRRLCFGSAITTWSHVEKLQTLGITHVVNLRRNKHRKKLRQFKSLWLPFRDDKKPRPKWFYRRALHFHVRAMRRRHARLFVMCHHGICRSASLTYFLLRSNGLSNQWAQSAVIGARPRAIICRAYRESGEIFLALESGKKTLARNKSTKS